jgi:hypothetical protein
LPFWVSKKDGGDGKKGNEEVLGKLMGVGEEDISRKNKGGVELGGKENKIDSTEDATLKEEGPIRKHAQRVHEGGYVELETQVIPMEVTPSPN